MSSALIMEEEEDILQLENSNRYIEFTFIAVLWICIFRHFSSLQLVFLKFLFVDRVRILSVVRSTGSHFLCYEPLVDVTTIQNL